MATAQCFSLVRGSAMRVTALDGCGRPVLGPCSSITSEGFVSVAFTSNTDAGTAISVVNAAGKVCIADAACPTFVNYTVEITFCEVNPELLAMITGQNPVFDTQSDIAAGFRMNSDISPCDSGFALELWSKVPAVACDPADLAAQGSYGYLLLPFLQGGVLGDFTIENDAVSFVVSGAGTKTGSGWDRGPYNVVANANGNPGPLRDPILSGDHLHVQVTSVAPPEGSCDCAPNGIPATYATEIVNQVGTWGPANSYAPSSFDQLSDPESEINAIPTAPWASGSRVALLDGTFARWNGVGWVVWTGGGGTPTNPNAPTIGTITPLTGPAAGSTTVTITGTKLDTVTAVSFGGVNGVLEPGGTATSITVATPVLACNEQGDQYAPVVLHGSQGSTNADTFIYEMPDITGISPASGPTTGGTSVTITGVGLTVGGGKTLAVTFDGVAGTITGTPTDTEIIVTTPLGSAGPANVDVRGLATDTCGVPSISYNYTTP